MSIFFSLQRPVAAVVILLFALSAADVRISEASEGSTGAVVILPPHCAMAFVEAMGDLEEWFASHPTPQYTNIKEYFQHTRGQVKCSEKDDWIEIYLYSSEPGIRGGGVKYIIGKKDIRVLERFFDR